MLAQEPILRTNFSDEQLHVELRISAALTAPCDFWNQSGGSDRLYHCGKLSGYYHELRSCLQFRHFLRGFLQAAGITGANEKEAETDLQVLLTFVAKNLALK